MPSFPSVTFNIVAPQQLAGVTAHKVLIVGQQLSGTAVAGELQQNVNTVGGEDALFGARSHIAGLIREFRRINKATQVDAIGLADASGTAGTAIVTIVGTATEDNTLIVNLGSARQHSISIDVLSGETATQVADKITAAAALDTKSPFTVGNVAGVVTATASNDGTLSNAWAVQVVGAVAGITPTITAGWTGGATDPVLTTLFDPVANIRYNTVVWPQSFTITELTDFLDPRFNTNNDVLDGVGIFHKNDTLSNLKTAVVTLNSQSVRPRTPR